MSEHRISYVRYQPGLQAMQALNDSIHESGLEPNLLELVKLRASQINACAYCLDMHWKDARVLGETEQRMFGLSAWREAPYYTDRERAALDLTEAVTKIADAGVPDVIIEQAQAHFTRDELAALMFAIVTINSWNRLAIAARAPAGSYEAPATATL